MTTPDLPYRTPSWLSAGISRGVPLDRAADDPFRLVLTVDGDRDHPGAIVTALRARLAVDAYRHYDELGALSPDDLYHLLIGVKRLADQARNLEESVLVMLRDAGASWATLGAALDTSRAAARERYLRIKEAGKRGLTAEAERAETDAELAALYEPDAKDER